MRFDPKVIVAAPDQSGCALKVDETLQRRVLEFVQQRMAAINSGQRTLIDPTYDNWGIESREYSIRRGDHERASYYDWYLNQLERGFDTQVREVRIIPVTEMAMLPFRYNVTWPIPPELELQIRTENGQVSWYVEVDDERLSVVLPNFVDAPWKEPILETRGGVVEFNASKFSKELGDHLGLEFVSWAVRLKGLVKIRAFALSVDPYYGSIHPSLLTDKENFDATGIASWSLGDWRLYGFTTSPNSNWPYGEGLCRLIKDYVSDKEQRYIHPRFDYWSQSKEDIEVLIACGKAVHLGSFQDELRRFDLTDDFKLGVFHSHDERCECNFALEGNQDIGVLIEQDAGK